MKLRTQLLLLSLLTLVLPWAGCQYVQEMEEVLRTGHEQALLANAKSVARTLRNRPVLLYRDASLFDRQYLNDARIYAHPLSSEILVDGYPSDWRSRGASIASSLPPLEGDAENTIQYRAGINKRYLYLFVSVADEEVVYDAAGTPGDSILVRTVTTDDTTNSYLFSTLAPGLVAPSHTRQERPWTRMEREEPRIRANWQQTGSGYNLELRIPLDLTGARFDFAVRDVDDSATQVSSSAGSSHLPDRPGLLIYASALLEAPLSGLGEEGSRLYVTDWRGFSLGQTGELNFAARTFPEDRPGRSRSILGRLYRSILDIDDPPYSSELVADGKISGGHVSRALSGMAGQAWFRLPGDERAVVAVAQPILNNAEVMGAVVVEQTSDSILTLTNRALTRLLNFTLLAMIFAAAGLLGFATWLSFRIGRLRNAAEHALSPKGKIETRFPGQRSRDELGDLSRSFSQLMAKLRDYNHYLQTLGEKLSHELRTPLAVVRSSLENLDAENIPDGAREYSARAKDGVGRLSAILSSLGEATHVEQAIATAERESFDIGELMTSAGQAYCSTYTDHRLRVDVAAGAHRFAGVPDLLIQMLDKLIQNALDFTPAGGDIWIKLVCDDENYVLVVGNEGPPLPEKMRSQLFDSMVSLRQNRQRGSHHLGLGLYIVRLIATFHSGSVSAHNLSDGSGVEFRVSLPRDESFP